MGEPSLNSPPLGKGLTSGSRLPRGAVLLLPSPVLLEVCCSYLHPLSCSRMLSSLSCLVHPWHDYYVVVTGESGFLPLHSKPPPVPHSRATSTVLQHYLLLIICLPRLALGCRLFLCLRALSPVGTPTTFLLTLSAPWWLHYNTKSPVNSINAFLAVLEAVTSKVRVLAILVSAESFLYPRWRPVAASS